MAQSESQPVIQQFHAISSVDANLHLDDIHQHALTNDDEACCSACSFNFREGTAAAISLRSKLKLHVKLFKRYLSTCEQSGVFCALDSDLSSDDSTTCDEYYNDKPQRDPDCTANSSNRFRENRPIFSSQRRGLSLNRTWDVFNDNNGVCREVSNISLNTCIEPRVGSDIHEGGAIRQVFKRQVASALGAGRPVWL
jgi:hypothetical protein